MKALIIDGYIDEPTNLGVPPYLSTYPRYIAGVLSILNFEVTYITIDKLRTMDFELPYFDLMILIAGFTVPGKYLGGVPIKLNEIDRISYLNFGKKILCGPVTYGYINKGGERAIDLDISRFDNVFFRDYEKNLYEIISKKTLNEDHYSFIDKISKEGAFIYSQHPNYPYVIAEIETSKGCDRKSFCSYCTEFLKGRITYRKPEGIASEIKALYDNGCKYFRIGKQSNILSYMGPEPNLKAVKTLYSLIYEVAPNLRVLHTDNANSLFIKRYPLESAKILEVIASNVTPGDVLPFGIETFDPKVIKINNLKTFAEDSIYALKLVSDIGSYRINGIPKILPGINLLFGLSGETKSTYKINLHYLRKIVDYGILLRRINIRKVVLFEQTPLFKMKRKFFPRDFEHFKNVVRNEIDRPMLKKVFPRGTILKEVIVEKNEGGVSFGRQLGSYPILTGVYGDYPIGKPVNVVIVDYGFRSLSGFAYPIDLKKLSIENLRHIPGIGKKRAEKIYNNRFLPLEKLFNLIDSEDTIDFLKKFTLH